MNVISKIFSYLKNAWKAETPRIAKMAQIILTIISAISLYLSTLSDEFRNSIDENFLKKITYIGIVAVVLLNFSKKQQ